MQTIRADGYAFFVYISAIFAEIIEACIAGRKAVVVIVWPYAFLPNAVRVLVATVALPNRSVFGSHFKCLTFRIF